MTEAIPTQAVKAVIVNSADEVLFLQRNPETRDQANYDLPGGLVEDESETEALARELAEELPGLEVRIGEKVGEWSFFRPLDGKMVRVTNYLCQLIGGTLELSDEHMASLWATRAAARDLPVKDPSLFDALG